jgi:hypothetical protein
LCLSRVGGVQKKLQDQGVNLGGGYFTGKRFDFA